MSRPAKSKKLGDTSSHESGERKSKAAAYPPSWDTDQQLLNGRQRSTQKQHVIELLHHVIYNAEVDSARTICPLIMLHS